MNWLNSSLPCSNGMNEENKWNKMSISIQSIILLVTWLHVGKRQKTNYGRQNNCLLINRRRQKFIWAHADRTELRRCFICLFPSLFCSVLVKSRTNKLNTMRSFYNCQKPILFGWLHLAITRSVCTMPHFWSLERKASECKTQGLNLQNRKGMKNLPLLYICSSDVCPSMQ